MNCGLSNLETLKRHLLPANTLAGETRFDQVMQDIGVAVDGLFDSFTNRKLAYLAAAEVVITGDYSHYTLPRYPVVSVTTIKSRAGDSASWAAISGQPWNTDLAAGIVRFNETLGSDLDQVQIVWTGGYWFETKEPEEAGYPTTVPTGATVLPGDLRGAFLMQCRVVWSSFDKTGTGLLKTGGAAESASGSLAGLDLIPMVKSVLQGHIRYQLS